MEAADSPTDNTPPTGVDLNVVSTGFGLIDANGTIYATPNNCPAIPTRQIRRTSLAQCFSTTDIVTEADCNGDADCLAALNCDPCQIEVVEDGCACDNPANMFGTPGLPTSVTGYKQTLYVTSPFINDAGDVTISNVEGIIGGMGGITVMNAPANSDAEVILMYFVAPSTPYSFNIAVAAPGGAINLPFEGQCGDPTDPCACPEKPEICGDGIDNDLDGAIDAADTDITSNCELDCDATPIEIQGQRPVTNMLVTTSIWTDSRCCGANAFNNPSPVDENSVSTSPPTPFRTATPGTLPAKCWQ